MNPPDFAADCLQVVPLRAVLREGAVLIEADVPSDAEGGYTAHVAARMEFTDDIGFELARRIAATWDTWLGIDTGTITAAGLIQDHQAATAEGDHIAQAEIAAELRGALIPPDQYHFMQIAALLLHRFALRGETVHFTADEIQRFAELYPAGGDVIAADAEDGGIKATLTPPGEKPSGIILPQQGPGRLLV